MENLDIHYNFLPTANNKILAIVHWEEERRLRTCQKVGSTEEQLQKFVNEKRKEIIIKLLTKFVNQRDYSLNHNLIPKSSARINAVSKIKKGLEVYGQSSLYRVSQIILCLEQDLNELLPGKASKHYEYHHKKINQILTFCKNITNDIN
ncbi:MAG: hypothetical protein J5I47_01845 [Vicingus serpentipes]|nr:hypothetical protein [Vicingus serpentipes]